MHHASHSLPKGIVYGYNAYEWSVWHVEFLQQNAPDNLGVLP